MKKVIFIWLLFLQVFVSSCIFFCSCGGCGKGEEHRINILSWTVDTINEKYDPVDPAIAYPYLEVAKIISIGDRQIVQSSWKEKGSLLAKAHACSPAPAEANQTFTSIQVISVIETNYANSTDLIFAGQDITDRFLISHGYYSNFEPIELFINELVIYDGDRFLLRMSQPPGQPTTLMFDIIITLSDGRVFELEDQVMSVM